MQVLITEDQSRERIGELGRQIEQQLPEALGLNVQCGDAGPLAGNAQEFNVHDASARAAAIACVNSARSTLIKPAPILQPNRSLLIVGESV